MLRWILSCFRGAKMDPKLFYGSLGVLRGSLSCFRGAERDPKLF